MENETIDLDYVRKTIDMGTWQYSWHNNLKTAGDYDKAIETIDDMIKERIKQLNQLQNAREFLECQ